MQEEARRRRERYAAELAAQIAADQAARRTAWQSAQRGPGPGPTPKRGSERRAWPGGRRYDAASGLGASGGARQATGAARAAGGAGDRWADGQLAGRSRETMFKEHAQRAQPHAEAGAWLAAAGLQQGAERSGLLQASSDRGLSAALTATGKPRPAAAQLPLYPGFQESHPQGAVQGSGQHAGYPAASRQLQPAHVQERMQQPSAQQALPSSAWTHGLPTQAARPSGLAGDAVRQHVLSGQAPQLTVLPNQAWPYAPPGQAAQPGDVSMHGAQPSVQPSHAARPVRTPMYRRRSSVRMAQAGLEPGSGALAASGQQAARLRQAAYRYMPGMTVHAYHSHKYFAGMQTAEPTTLLHVYDAVQQVLLVPAGCDNMHGMCCICRTGWTAYQENRAAWVSFPEQQWRGARYMFCA